MKTIIILIILSFSLCANTLSLKVNKETNGGYLLSLPHLELENHKDLFLHKLNFDLLFTSPREDFQTPNHYGISVSNAFGVEYKDVFLTFSLDLKYIFLENDYGEKDGLQFGNTLEVGIKF